ncbi:MAG TPA: thiamine pyrophosphate-dependent dehydrogenase E1 component subunit alpha [Rhodospirillales bacterium]|nr:thiamine pyrophosphate-dependent dehydrogenase E1 component subunit alpha [Rhodospirillales bacterium]
MDDMMPEGGADNPSTEDIERLFRSLHLVRRSEERIADIYPSDRIKSPVHLSIGQEAVAVGVCDVLGPQDYAAGTYRGHAMYLARNGNLPAMMAELYGKAGGCAAGKGGSMHLVDMENKIIGCSAVVSTNIPIAVGFALKLKRHNERALIACFLGDGASEEGVFYESLNFAALHSLPILFICENNALAIHTPIEKRWASNDLGMRVKGFGVRFQITEDPDIFRIRSLAAKAIDRIRQGQGPELIECHTYRWREHVGPNEDLDADYRSPEAFAHWQENDQIPRLAAMLSDEARQNLEDSVEKEIAEAITFAEQGSFPEIDKLHTDVFAE